MEKHITLPEKKEIPLTGRGKRKKIPHLLLDGRPNARDKKGKTVYFYQWEEGKKKRRRCGGMRENLIKENGKERSRPTPGTQREGKSERRAFSL